MPRVKRTFPHVAFHVSLPQETVARLRLLFYSADSVRGITRGAISDFINAAILEKFERLAAGKGENAELQSSESGAS